MKRDKSSLYWYGLVRTFQHNLVQGGKFFGQQETGHACRKIGMKAKHILHWPVAKLWHSYSPWHLFDSQVEGDHCLEKHVKTEISRIVWYDFNCMETILPSFDRLTILNCHSNKKLASKILRALKRDVCTKLWCKCWQNNISKTTLIWGLPGRIVNWFLLSYSGLRVSNNTCTPWLGSFLPLNQYFSLFLFLFFDAITAKEEIGVVTRTDQQFSIFPFRITPCI